MWIGKKLIRFEEKLDNPGKISSTVLGTSKKNKKNSVLELVT